MTETTSIYKDYIDLTKTYQKQYGENTILLMQVGAFFEVYGFKCSKSGVIQDSKIEEFTQMCNLNASEKKIVYETRQVLMAGFRDYSLDKYLQKIMDYGFTAVVYVQDKSGKNITRVLDAVHSPGTYISYETECLPQMSNNIMCIWLERFKPRTKIGSKDVLICGLSVANIFTGKSAITEFQSPYELVPTTFDELERCVSIYSPSEVIIISTFSEEDLDSVLQFSGLGSHMVHIVNSEMSEKAKKCEKQQHSQHILDTFFGKESVQTYAEFSTYSIATQSFCYLLDFIQDHNPNLVKKIGIPDFHISNQMLLANHTLKQLNILADESNPFKKSSLSSVSTFLNKSSTPMGRRLFHQQIVSPTTDIEWLNKEYDITAKMLDQYDMVPQCRKILGKIRDLDKICRQIIVKKIYPSTIFHLYESLDLSQQILTCFQDLPEILNYVAKDLNGIRIQEFLVFLDSQFYMDRCSSISSFSNIEDTFIKPGVSASLDQLYLSYKENTSNFSKIHQYFNKLIQSESKSIDTTEYVKIHETEKSGSTLQITKKRGIILKSILAKRESISIPGIPIVIETKDVKLVSASGSADEIEFTFLRNTCRDILYQKDGLTRLLVSTYCDILTRIESEWYQTIEQISQTIAKLDVLQCKAFIAREFNYCRPVIDANVEKAFVKSEQLRHCLIEHIQQNEIYVPNDLHIGCDGQDGMLVYGTNAVGKTSLIRALGISVIMAQAGLYVPCSKFTYRPYTAIFSRILGNDNLFKGLSTFAVEMSELRIILKMADENSLVLGDELCSGTETESALSIFVSGLQHLHGKKSSFLFATHFHEIIGYDEIKELYHLVLKHMSVIYDRQLDALIYDRRLCNGPGNRMYGLEVCKSLHLDDDFLENAYRIREKYFSRSELSFDSSPYNTDKVRGMCELCNEKPGEETHHLNPQKSADANGFIGTFHKNHGANLMTVCSKCHDEQHSKKKTIIRKKSTKGYVNLTLE
jgi:DNA mismatch repair protein MutS